MVNDAAHSTMNTGGGRCIRHAAADQNRCLMSKACAGRFSPLPKHASLPFAFCSSLHYYKKRRYSRYLFRAGDEPSGDGSTAEDLVQSLLANDPEAAGHVARMSEAAQRVAELQMEQNRLARALQEAENGSQEYSQEYSQESQRRMEAGAVLAEAEAKAAKLLLRAAELEAEQAASLRDAMAFNAQQEAERVESVKVGGLAAAGGLAASLPYVALTTSSFAASLATLSLSTISALLFGLVYRYAVRRNLDNVQLKAGVVAAFGLVQGLSIAVTQMTLGSKGFTESLAVESLIETAAVSVGESMLVFGFASAAVEFAFRQRWAKPFD